MFVYVLRNRDSWLKYLLIYFPDLVDRKAVISEHLFPEGNRFKMTNLQYYINSRFFTLDEVKMVISCSRNLKRQFDIVPDRKDSRLTMCFIKSLAFDENKDAVRKKEKYNEITKELYLSHQKCFTTWENEDYLPLHFLFDTALYEIVHRNNSSSRVLTNILSLDKRGNNKHDSKRNFAFHVLCSQKSCLYSDN